MNGKTKEINAIYRYVTREEFQKNPDKYVYKTVEVYTINDLQNNNYFAEPTFKIRYLVEKKKDNEDAREVLCEIADILEDKNISIYEDIDRLVMEIVYVEEAENRNRIAAVSKNVIFDINDERYNLISSTPKSSFYHRVNRAYISSRSKGENYEM